MPGIPHRRRKRGRGGDRRAGECRSLPQCDGIALDHFANRRDDSLDPVVARRQPIPSREEITVRHLRVIGVGRSPPHPAGLPPQQIMALDHPIDAAGRTAGRRRTARQGRRHWWSPHVAIGGAPNRPDLFRGETFASLHQRGGHRLRQVEALALREPNRPRIRPHRHGHRMPIRSSPVMLPSRVIPIAAAYARTRVRVSDGPPSGACRPEIFGRSVDQRRRDVASGATSATSLAAGSRRIGPRGDGVSPFSSGRIARRGGLGVSGRGVGGSAAKPSCRKGRQRQTCYRAGRSFAVRYGRPMVTRPPEPARIVGLSRTRQARGHPVAFEQCRRQKLASPFPQRQFLKFATAFRDIDPSRPRSAPRVAMARAIAPSEPRPGLSHDCRDCRLGTGGAQGPEARAAGPSGREGPRFTQRGRTLAGLLPKGDKFPGNGPQFVECRPLDLCIRQI